MSDKSFPSHARVVIVGGGVMGVGLAYHLAHEGWGPQVVLFPNVPRADQTFTDLVTHPQMTHARTRTRPTGL